MEALGGMECADERGRRGEARALKTAGSGEVARRAQGMRALNFRGDHTVTPGPFGRLLASGLT